MLRFRNSFCKKLNIVVEPVGSWNKSHPLLRDDWSPSTLMGGGLWLLVEKEPRYYFYTPANGKTIAAIYFQDILVLSKLFLTNVY